MGCLFGYAGLPDDSLLPKMASRLNHRCGLGWERARLQVNDELVMEIGHGIPPWSAAARVCHDPRRHLALGYSGVIFRGPGGLADEPSKDADAETILSALGRYPKAGLPSLEGAFVAAVAEEGGLSLVRDPSGVKVLYWTRQKDRLLFASEIKALFADPSVPRRMRLGALPEYLTFSFVPGERTMFEGIRELQPGTILRYRDQEARLHRHFTFEDHEWRGDQEVNPADFARRVREDLERSVAECCELSPSPPAVFVSGGIDSSAVLALTAERFPGAPIRTFSVHFGSRYANENEYVAMMVDRYRTNHSWLEIRPSRFVKRMRDIIWKLDDPIGDPITVPNFLMAEAASRVAGIVLNGEGGDPCFGGPKNLPMMLADVYGPLPGDPPEGWRERNYLLSYRKCFEDLEQMLAPDVFRETGGETPLLAVIAPFLEAASPAGFLNRLMAINILRKGANLILVKVDKMTSANGILALPPLFSKRIIQTAMACPPRLKLNGNIEKAILKQAVGDILPEPIVHRPKSGMMVPVRFWFQKELRRYARRMLSKRRLKRIGFFNVDYIQKLLRYDKTEIRSQRHGLKLWMLITFLLWHEQMVEGNIPSK